MSSRSPFRRLTTASALLALAALVGLDACLAEGAANLPPRLQGDDARLRFRAGRRATIPLILQNNHVWTRGSINGTDSVSILFDTGAQGDCIRELRAQAIGLELSRPHESHGAGGTVQSFRTEKVDLGIPGLELRGGRLGTLPLQEIGAQTGRDLDVIVGRAFFTQSVVIIDYARETMEVHDPKGWEYRGSGVVLPLTFERGHPYVTARLTLPGREPVEGRFVVDTGSAAALILNAEFTTQHRVLEAVGRTIEIASGGVGGQILSPLGRVERLEIGGIALERPVTMFRTAGPGFVSAGGSLGNIGGGILRRFTVIFDYTRSRMILEPGPRVPDPFEHDMSGLALRTTGGDHRRFVVSRITAGSPAAEVGLAVGDELVAIDGRPAHAVGLLPLRELFRKEGAEYRLEVEREGKKHEVAIRTRRMI